MSEYLLEIITIIIALVNPGEIISNEDLVMYTLGGLGEEHEQFIQNVTSLDTNVSFEGQHAMLFD